MSQAEPQTVVITGATGHVGAALVRHLLGKMPLALLGRDLSGLGSGLDPDARVARVSHVDVTDEQSIASGVAQARAALGPIRALVHTVGGWTGGIDVRDQSLDATRQMLEMNFLSAVNAVKAVLPDLLSSRHGRIILFASADALRGRAGAAAYAASKAALLRFAEALAEELAPNGVGVRVMAPTTIDTPVNRTAMPTAQFSDWVSLDEVAHAVEFALSPASSGLRFAVVPLGR